MLDLKEFPDGIVFKIFVQPKSSKNAIVGIHKDALKVKLTAPPVDGAANKMGIKYLSKVLNIAKSRMEIVSGQTNRNKKIRISLPQGAAGEAEKQRLIALLNSF